MGEDELQNLRREAFGYRNAAFATNTKRTYKSQIACYMKFCVNFGFLPVPATQETLTLYCSFLARSLSASSIPGYLNVIRLMHVESGFANPLANNWEVSSIQKGISRMLGKPPKQKSPITVNILLDLFSTLENHPTDTAFWAACLIAFFGFMRKSTLLPTNDLLLARKFIARHDIVDLSLSSFFVVIRHSKTIQFGQRLLTLPYVSSTDHRLCPVRALLKHLGSSKLPKTSPLFNFSSSGVEMQFTHAFFVKRLKLGLTRTGNRASDVSCHSFRRGGATLAFAMGVSAIDIKLRGDWRSNAFEKYLVISPSDSLKSVKSMTMGAADMAASRR